MTNASTATTCAAAQRGRRVGRWEWQDAVLLSDLPAPCRALAWALFRHMDAAGTCWPGGARLERMAGMSERTRRRNMHLLEAARYIHRVPRAGAITDCGRTNRYVAIVPWLQMDRAREDRQDAGCEVCREVVSAGLPSEGADMLARPSVAEERPILVSAGVTSGPQSTLNLQENRAAPRQVTEGGHLNCNYVAAALREAGYDAAASRLLSDRQRRRAETTIKNKLASGGWSIEALTRHLLRAWPERSHSPAGMIESVLRSAPEADPEAIYRRQQAERLSELNRDMTADRADTVPDHVFLELAQMVELMAAARPRTTTASRIAHAELAGAGVEDRAIRPVRVAPVTDASG